LMATAGLGWVALVAAGLGWAAVGGSAAVGDWGWGSAAEGDWDWGWATEGGDWGSAEVTEVQVVEETCSRHRYSRRGRCTSTS